MLVGLSLARYAVTAPKDLDPQKVIAEVIARFPAARDFDLTNMVEKALAWEEVKRNEDTTRARAMRALFTADTNRNYTALLALYVRGLTESIKTEELLSAFRTYAPRATRKEEKTAKEQLSALYDLSETQAVLTDVGREVLTEWRDMATRTGLIRTAAASPRVLDMNGPIAPYLDYGRKAADRIYRNWPARLDTKEFGAKLSNLLKERSFVPYIYKGKDTVASGAYLMSIDVYQKLRGNRIDLFDSACDRTFGTNRTGKDAEDAIRMVSPTEAEIEAALASGPLPIRGVVRLDFAIDIGIPGKGLSTTIPCLLKKAGYSRFRLYWIKKHEMILITDADTGKKLITAMFMRLD